MTRTPAAPRGPRWVGGVAVVPEPLEQRLAMAKLREVIAEDRQAFGEVSEVVRRQAEREW